MSVETIPVLLYHSVGPPTGHAEDPWGVDRCRFEEHVDLFVRSGRVSITLSQLGRALSTNPASVPERPIVVSFDDGYADNLAAAEMLGASGLHASIFVTTDYLDEPRMLSVPTLRRLAALPTVEIGAHSVSHPYLDALPTDDVEIEVRESKDALEQLLSERVETFAYPHGAYSLAVREVVKETGYVAAAAVKDALSHRNDDPFAIARTTIKRDTPLETIADLMEGRGAPIAAKDERLRTRAARILRRARRLSKAARR